MAFVELAGSSPSGLKSISRPLTAQPHPNRSMTIPNFSAQNALSKLMIICPPWPRSLKVCSAFETFSYAQCEHDPRHPLIESLGRAVSGAEEKFPIELESGVRDAIEMFPRTFAGEERLSVTHHAQFAAQSRRVKPHGLCAVSIER
jgi:hypothetical protein